MLCCCLGNMTQCPFGIAPSSHMPMPRHVVSQFGTQMGNITDVAPMVNVVSFTLCKSPLNPSTAALTAAAGGILTPGPCIPAPVGTWIPMKPNVICVNAPILVDKSILLCSFGGAIKFNVAGQTRAMT